MPNRSSAGFTLVEIMIVVAIIGLLASLAIPSFTRARNLSQRNACMNNMRQVEAAKAQASLDLKRSSGALTWNEIASYLKVCPPVCAAGGVYTMEDIGQRCWCSMHDWRNNPDYEGFSP